MGKGKDTRKTNSHAHATSLYLNFANKHSAAAVPIQNSVTQASQQASKAQETLKPTTEQAASKQGK